MNQIIGKHPKDTVDEIIKKAFGLTSFNTINNAFVKKGRIFAESNKQSRRERKTFRARFALSVFSGKDSF